MCYYPCCGLTDYKEARDLETYETSGYNTWIWRIEFNFVFDKYILKQEYISEIKNVKESD